MCTCFGKPKVDAEVTESVLKNNYVSATNNVSIVVDNFRLKREVVKLSNNEDKLRNLEN